jgi:hypothetical protein
VASTDHATVRLSRDHRGYRHAYRIVVDGASAGELGRGDTKEISVDAGTHAVWVATELAESRRWGVSLGEGERVGFECRSRSKQSEGPVDLFLTDPGDLRARLLPPADDAEPDPTRRQRVVSRDGQVHTVWAHRSGYLRSLDPGSGSASGDAFLVELAYYVFVLPVLGVVRWVRHRLVFKGGWSVGVVRPRRFLWPKKIRVDRFRTEAEARARVSGLIAELEGRP